MVSQPYVPGSVYSAWRWADRNAALAYKLALLSLYDKDRYYSIISKGMAIVEQNNRYSQFCDDFLRFYDGKPRPSVTDEFDSIIDEDDSDSWAKVYSGLSSVGSDDVYLKE